MFDHLSADSQRNPKPAWIAIFSLSAFIGLCLLVGIGRILVPIFPLGSLAVGLFLYWRYPIFYLGFTWWLWFVGPLIRRIIDYQSGYLTYGPWTLTPLLVTFISVITLVKYLPTTYKSGGFPFILPISGIVYGFLIGLIQNPQNLVVNQFLAWLCPVLFAFHLFVHWQEYPIYRHKIQRIFLWGTLVMGIYGVIQYLVAPAWDSFWLRSIENLTFGKPEPLGIRVSSTMESPQSFANMMMAGLLLLFSHQEKIRFLAAAGGYLSFLLSKARSAWVGWFIAMISFLISLKSSLQIRLIVTIMIASIFVVPLATIEPFSTVITSRLETLSDKEDSSMQHRMDGYSDLFNVALSEFQGKGLGFVIHSGGTIGSRDSSILSLLFSLGWVGTIPYLGGFFLLFVKLFRATERRFDPFAGCAFAIVLGMFTQVGLNMIFDGSMAMVFWGFLGVGIAANKYYFYKKLNS